LPQTRIRILQEANEGLMAAAAAAKAKPGPNGTPPIRGPLRRALAIINGLGPNAARKRSPMADGKAPKQDAAAPASE
jgi:hypothetical protein